VRIADFDFADRDLVEQAARLLVEGFSEHWPEAWPTLDDALEEMHGAAEAGRLARVALDDDGRSMLGWVGAIPQYDGNVWELHPLVVAHHARGRGVGRALVEDLEREAASRGGLTMVLGSDDDDDMTSLSGVDLYDDLPRRLATIENRRRHPFEFYQRLGFVITGVVPDANGRGKPDILMAKRLQPPGGA